jgi:hypothetical protein
MLALLGQSEEMYRLETDYTYWECSSTNDCNTLLTLSIPTGTSRQWDYTVVTSGDNEEFCAEATNTEDGRTFRFYPAGGDREPVSGTCPAL